MKKKSEANDIELAREILRAAGLRSTPARIAVLIALQKGNKPQTHAELSERLVPLGFDKATVFRNLTDLTDVELVSRTELGDCGTVSCMEGMSLPDDKQRKSLNISRISEILVKGHCSVCEPV